MTAYGLIVPLEDASRFIIETSENETFHGIEGVDIGDGKAVELGDSIVTLTDVWDLTMLGVERLDVEHKYQMLTNGQPWRSSLNLIVRRSYRHAHP